MRVFHFINRQFGLEDLRRRRIKIATLGDLNDPFELFCIDLSNKELRFAFRRMKDKLAASSGMLCFSRSWQNPVQWSHYAEKHKGLCLGFDVPDNTLLEVSYTGKRLADEANAIVASGRSDKETMKRFLSTKYRHWSYENEVRCFFALEEADRETGLFFADFSPTLILKQVIVGSASTINRHELADALGDLAGSVEAFQARLAFKSFRVVRQHKESLWS